MRSVAEIPQVAVWIESSTGYGRGLIRGIADFVRQHGPWSIYFTPHGLREPLSTWLRNWRGGGILARIDDDRTARMLIARKLPLIDLRGRLPNLGLPRFVPDPLLVAQLAFEHLQERGFRHYGFFGLPRGEHVDMERRRNHFRGIVTKAGWECHVFEGGRHGGRTSDWNLQQTRVGKWLTRLPKPIGIMCCDDVHGHHLLDVCNKINVAVPDQVAVIGVDNDEALCILSAPALSSISVNASGIGYGAAAMLDRIMAEGKLIPPDEFLFPPKRVITRLSTDTLAVDDLAVAKAIRFIRDHACGGIDVGDVVEVAGTSRRYLERKMQALLGRSPNQEILRVRINRARVLLLETDLSLQAIAQKTAFRSTKYLGDVFIREVGQPPGELRRRAREARGLPEIPRGGC